MYYDWNYTYTVGQVHDKRSGIFLCQLLVSEGCVKKNCFNKKISFVWNMLHHNRTLMRIKLFCCSLLGEYPVYAKISQVARFSRSTVGQMSRI
jgi:hypothetical protein